MKELLIVLSVCLVLALSFGGAHAALVEMDLVSGSHDALLTHDTESGLYWLDLTYTVGLSGWDVILNTAAGYDFTPFRYATLPEVDVLFDHAGVDLNHDAWTANYPDNVSNVSNLVGLLGMTELKQQLQPDGTTDITHWSRGWVDPARGTEPYYADLVSFFYGVSIPSGATTAYSLHSTDEWPISFTSWKGTPAGHFLVKITDAVIPEPTSMVLLSFGLLAVGVFRRKK